MKQRLGFVATYWLMLALASSAIAQGSPLKTRQDIYRVTSSGELLPATEALPGETVEYHIVVTNVGETTLPVGIVRLSVPIVGRSSYVVGSASRLDNVLVEFSTTDDESFAEYAVEEEPPNTTAIQWALLYPMEPDAELHVAFRVKLDSVSAGASEGTLAQGSLGGVVDGFHLVSYQGEWEYGTLYVIGEVQNVGARAAGVQLQAIARDASGRLVDAGTFWPASTANIRPGMSFGIRYPVTDNTNAVTLELQIVDTTVW